MSIAAINVRDQFRGKVEGVVEIPVVSEIDAETVASRGDPVRLLVIPGLNDSGPAHWQTWLEGQYAERAVRVQQDDWAHADLEPWADRIGETLVQHPQSRWVAAAHSFGTLALLRFLQRGGQGVQAALLVALADPAKFGVSSSLPQSRLAIPTVLLASETDPWMHFQAACAWARVWGTRLVNLGDAGHINTESGFGPMPQAKSLVETMIHRLEGERRTGRTHPLEISFAI
jgi:predicted alpha/beta hydrolase family esterase